MNQAEATNVVNACFEALAPFLMRYAFRRTQSVQVAEDVVQEAFLSLYRDLRVGKDVRDPNGWLVGAVRNQVRKHGRSLERHREDLFPTDSLDLLESTQSFVLEGEGSPPLVLDVLSPREEEVVLLRLQSFKYRQIADQLGITTKSVSTLLARAVKKLQTNRANETASGEERVPRREVRNALR